MTVTPFLPNPAPVRANGAGAGAGRGDSAPGDAGPETGAAFGDQLASAVAALGGAAVEAPVAQVSMPPAPAQPTLAATLPGQPALPSGVLGTAVAAGAATPANDPPGTAQVLPGPADAGATPAPPVGSIEVVAAAMEAVPPTTLAVPGAGTHSLGVAAPGTPDSAGALAMLAAAPAGDTHAGLPGRLAAQPGPAGATAAASSAADGAATEASLGPQAGPALLDAAPLEAAPPSASASATGPTGPAPVGGPVPAAPVTTPAVDAAPTTEVVRQVFPEVTRVATTPGTHRITVTLNPEALGEVRVTVVVRGGEVQVSMAASTEGAQRALLEGTAELHRLLERTGSVDPRVVVRDTTATSGQQSQSGQSAGQSAAEQHRDDQGRPAAYGSGGSERDQGDQRAWTAPERQHAREAAARTTDPAGAPRRTDDPTGRVRLDRLM